MDFALLSLAFLGLALAVTTMRVPAYVAPFSALAFPAAYSLRKLRSGHTGYCIRVRRSSDNATLDVGFAADGWVDVEAILEWSGETDSVYVVIWYDQSGNANDITNATTSAQPRIVDAGLVLNDDGNPTIYFSGAQSLYRDNPTGLPLGSNESALVVVALATGTAAATAFSYGTALQNRWRAVSKVSGAGKAIRFTVNNGGLTTTDVWPETMICVSALFSGGTVSGWRGNSVTSPATASATIATTGEQIRIGAAVNAGVEPFTGRISEAIVCTAADRAAVVANGMIAYGI